MIELNRVSKTYGDGENRVTALDQLDLHVAAGQFVSIMGASGSGKSTLLNLVSALDGPSAGSIRIDGQEISSLDDDALTLFRRRKIGLIFQFFNLLPTLSALDNVLLPVMLERRASAEDRARAAELLERVGLRTRAHHFTHQLSGGQMQRVAIARSLMMRPRLILADEPTGNLDSVTGEATLALLRETCESTGTTIVMVTHDRKAAEVGDRILELKDGQVVRDEATRASAGPKAAE
ncbi:MAG: Lipoprotein releasing system ATP-binding protein LolD [Myxococcaceae bacterium]|nr:Lipoprotein releasing system ATP-binding protein LolD [Myxococcaceae bacterium]